MCACPRSPRTYGAVSEVGAWGRPDGPCHLLGGAPPPGSLGLMGWCGVACGRACLPGGRGRSADRPRPRDPSFLCLQSADCTTRLVGTRCLSSVLWGFLGCDLEPGSRPGRAGRGKRSVVRPALRVLGRGCASVLPRGPLLGFCGTRAALCCVVAHGRGGGGGGGGESEVRSEPAPRPAPCCSRPRLCASPFLAGASRWVPFPV